MLAIPRAAPITSPSGCSLNASEPTASPAKMQFRQNTTTKKRQVNLTSEQVGSTVLFRLFIARVKPELSTVVAACGSLVACAAVVV